MTADNWWQRLAKGSGEFVAEIVGELALGLAVCAALFGLVVLTKRHPVIVGTASAFVLGFGIYGALHLKRTWRQTHVWNSSTWPQRIGLIAVWVLFGALLLGIGYGLQCECFF